MKLTPLKRIITKLRHLELPKAAKNILLIVSSLLIFDVLVTVLGASYLSENTWAFQGKSRTVILSDFLFLEGAVISALGIFVAVATAWQETKPSSEPTAEITDNAELTSDKRIHPGILMIIVGAILMGFSLMVGTLFL